MNIRSAAQAAVTAAADPKVFYLSLGGAFDRKNTANYATSDPTGSHIHPSDSGHAQVFTVVKNFLDATKSVRP